VYLRAVDPKPYSLGDAARILKVSPRRLRYWNQTRLLPQADPSARDFDFRDLLTVKAVVSLLEQGVSLRRIRRSVEELREVLPELDDPLASLRTWAQGSGRVVVRHEGVLVEPDGQMLLGLDADAARAGEAPGSGEPRPTVAALPRSEPAPPAEQRASAVEWFERGCELDADPSGYQEAIEAYRRALEIAPDYADAHCNLGAVYYNMGKRKPARACFEECLRCDPRHVEGHFNAANLLEEEGQDEMALRHYRAALEEDPLYPDVHVNLALVYERLGLARKAADHWRRYLQLEPRGSWSDVARQRLSRQR